MYVFVIWAVGGFQHNWEWPQKTDSGRHNHIRSQDVRPRIHMKVRSAKDRWANEVCHGWWQTPEHGLGDEVQTWKQHKALNAVEPSVQSEGQWEGRCGSPANYESMFRLDCTLHQRRGSIEHTRAGTDEKKTDAGIDRSQSTSTPRSRTRSDG